MTQNLSHTAILSCVANTILAVLPVNKRGYNVQFTYKKRYIVTRLDSPCPIIDEPLYPSRYLQYVDIKYLLNTTRSAPRDYDLLTLHRRGEARSTGRKLTTTQLQL